MTLVPLLLGGLIQIRLKHSWPQKPQQKWLKGKTAKGDMKMDTIETLALQAINAENPREIRNCLDSLQLALP